MKEIDSFMKSLCCIAIKGLEMGHEMQEEHRWNDFIAGTDFAGYGALFVKNDSGFVRDALRYIVNNVISLQAISL